MATLSYLKLRQSTELFLWELITFAQTINTPNMGRGDKKTKKGKIFKGSFGKVRPARIKKAKAAPEKKED